jgi:multiple sugar transport system substrate-binding protein
MIKKVRYLGWLVLLITLAGCSALPFDLSGGGTEPVSLTQTASSAVQSTQTPRPATPSVAVPPAESATPSGPLTLRLWVPPQFDPQGDTLAGNLLQNRLNEFRSRRPDVQIEVRVKAKDGPGGLYESLAATTAAAQLAMPDLVALPHPVIQTAAVKGLLRPMNGLTNALDDTDWYDYARQLAGLQNSIFGLPFAGDALVQVYRTGEDVQPATNWNAVLESTTPLAFAAADPQALFTLAQYQSEGGKIVDENGGPLLEADPLTKVFEFYKAGEQNEVIPFWLTQIQNEDQAWEAFREERADSLSAWFSRFQTEAIENTSFTQIPTSDGKPSTLAGGWIWSLTSPDPERRQLAVELAEFLTDSEFLSQWTEAAGVLPPRPSSLEAWSDTEMSAQLNPIASSAQLFPAPEVLNVIGPALQEAAVEVLKRQLEPQVAAQGAVNQLNLP